MKTHSARVVLVVGCSALFLAGIWLQPAASQAPQQETHAQRAERFRQMSVNFENTGLATPFKGITTNGQIETGLFAIRSTGVSTEPVRKAADTFLAALTT